MSITYRLQKYLFFYVFQMLLIVNKINLAGVYNHDWVTGRNDRSNYYKLRLNRPGNLCRYLSS